MCLIILPTHTQNLSQFTRGLALYLEAYVMYRFKKHGGDKMSACVYSDGLTGYCDKLKVSSLHYLEISVRFLRYWYWAMKNHAQRIIISNIIWFSKTLAPFIGPVWRLWLFFTYVILKQLYLRHATGIKLSICHLQGRFITGHLDTQIADIRPCTDRIWPRYQSARFLILPYTSIKGPILGSQGTVWKVQR